MKPVMLLLCVFFLFVWATEAYIEHSANGHWDIKNQKRRISSGVIGAVIGSGVFGLKFGGWIS